MKINTIKYVFVNKQPELRRIVVKYGLTPARDSRDLWKKVNYLVAKFKDEMLNDLASIHPDRELISWFNKNNSKPETSVNEPIKENINLGNINQGSKLPVIPNIVTNTTSNFDYENYSGVCGCSGADGEDSSDMGGCGCGCNNCNCENKSNAIGDVVTKNKMPLIVIGSLLAVGTLIFLGSRA